MFAEWSRHYFKKINDPMAMYKCQGRLKQGDSCSWRDLSEVLKFSVENVRTSMKAHCTKFH